MRLPYDGTFVISQLFGENPAMYAQFGLKGHNGIDFAIPTGTAILAPHNGVIKEAYFDAAGYGNYVKIENTVEGSVLGHLLSFSVTIGQTVAEGARIGISDNTGNSTGPHLHWGYYRFPRDRANGYNGFINQYSLIQPFLLQDETMTIGKKTYSDLLAKISVQESLIQSQTASIALKDKECQKRLQDKITEIKNKVIALANSLS